MFSKLSVAAVLVPFVSALTLNTPTGLSSGGPATITWTSEPTDPPFSIELVNVAFHDTFAIANNVKPLLNTISLNLPSVPVRDGYTLEAVNITNINQVYSSSSSFAIAATSSTTSSSASTLSSGSATSSASISASTTGSSSASVASSTSPSSSSSSASTTPSSFSGAMTKVSLGRAGPYAVMFLAAVAGAAVVAL